MNNSKSRDFVFHSFNDSVLNGMYHIAVSQSHSTMTSLFSFFSLEFCDSFVFGISNIENHSIVMWMWCGTSWKPFFLSSWKFNSTKSAARRVDGLKARASEWIEKSYSSIRHTMDDCTMDHHHISQYDDERSIGKWIVDSAIFQWNCA